MNPPLINNQQHQQHHVVEERITSTFFDIQFIMIIGCQKLKDLVFSVNQLKLIPQTSEALHP